MSDFITCPVTVHSQKSPDSLAIRTSGADFSYYQLEQQIRYLCIKLSEQGVKQGDRVAIISDNQAVVVALLFALQRLGASALFLSLQLRPSDWIDQLKMAQVRLLLGQEKYFESIDGGCEKLIPFEDLLSEFQSDKEYPETTENRIHLENECAIIFTSSTTGHKKGVVLRVQNFIASATASNQLTGLAPRDWWGASLPLFHVGGLGIIFRTILAGAGSSFLEDFSPATIYSEISQNKLTHLSLVPTVLEALITEAEKDDVQGLENLSKVKAIVLAGAASSPRLLEKIVRYNVPVLSAWGMTETTAHCTCMSLADSREKVTTVGKPFYHTEVKIIDDEGLELATAEEGEIIVKGPTICQGYLDPNMPAPRVVDGWLYTGDLGMFDADGYLTIKGRKDDMFISGGENIHAGEIESVVRKWEKINDAAIIPVPHEKWGHRPVLIAELRDGSSLSIEEVRSYLSGKIAKIKIPDQVYSMTSLPRTAIGKIDYKQLKKMYL